jgi:HlyD family secretion protein
MNEWSQNNLLIAPIDGSLSLSEYWNINQNVSFGDVIFSVIPDGLAQFKGRVFVPLVGAGKVKIGQKVNIKLDNYPYMEYGYIETTIVNKSRLPVVVEGEKFYIVDVVLPQTIVTNYNYKIDPDMEMYGAAEIITEDISIFKRVLMPFRYFTQKYINS